MPTRPGTRSLLILLLAACFGLAFALFITSGALARSPQAVAEPQVTWPQITLVQSVTGFDRPVHITHAGDGSGRIFVVEKPGRIRIVKDGVLQATPFLDITGRVRSNGGEQGLLSVAFPPGYASKGHFYVDYTDLMSNTVVSRFEITADPDVADPASEQIVLTVTQPYENHNGGQLAFGPDDGHLYIGMGDGGSGGDPLGNGQNPGVLLGKLLRIDVETGNPPTYTIPATNPFTQTAGYRDEIWALGLRNPWRFSFDPQTGDLYIGDVGQNLYEEVDYQPATSSGGQNYGWNIMEGFHCYNAATCDQTGLTLPVIEYDHTQGNCSITGGLVYRGSHYPALAGIYFYADFCSGSIWGLQREGATWQTTLLRDAPFLITSFGDDQDGNVWLTEYRGYPAGAIHRVAQAWLSYLPVISR
jgi:glucose/arabinose dehydrogenase